MKFTSASKFLVCAFIGSIVILSHADAAPITFMPPDEWPSTNWQQVNFGAPLVDTVTVNGDQWLEIARTTSNVGSGQIVYTAGASTATAANQFSDFTGSMLIRGSSGMEGGGIVFRAQNKNFGDANQYFLAITMNGAGTQGSIGIYNGTQSFLSQVTPLALQNASISGNVSYELTFSAIGSVLSGSLYQFDATSGLYDSLLASVEINNASLTSAGYVALRGGRYGSNESTMFDDFTLQSVPEPNGLALGALGALFLVVCLRRKSSGLTSR